MKKHIFILLTLISILLVSCKTKKVNNNINPETPEIEDIIPETPTMGDSYKIPFSYVGDSNFVKEMREDIISKNTIYCSPTGKGSNDGSKDKPYDLESGIDNLKENTTLILLDGTYNVGQEFSFYNGGNSSNYAVIKAQNKGKAIITSTSTAKEITLGSIEASYLIIDGLSFENVTSKKCYGLVMWDGGQNHVVIKNCSFKNLKTTGTTDENECNAILMMGESRNSINNILIYNNVISNLTLGYSEAISASGNCEYIYVLNNTLANNTNIGIDFYGNAGYCKDGKTILQELDQPRYCVAANNKVYKCHSPYASCAGIYVDGARDILIDSNYLYQNDYGIEIGSEEKVDLYPVKNIYVRNNLILESKEVGIRIGGYQKNDTGIVKSTYVYNNTLKNNKSEIVISKVDGIEIINNAFYSSLANDYETINIEFEDQYSKNITIQNNLSNKYNVKSNRNNIQESVLISNGNIKEVFTINDNGIISENIGVDKGKNVDSGKYDYCGKTRKINIIDIGCIEKQ